MKEVTNNNLPSGKYHVWADSESALDVPMQLEGKKFDSIDDAYNAASNFVHEYDDKDIRVIAHVEDDELEETVETIENIMHEGIKIPCDFCEYSYNTIELGDHKLTYSYLGESSGKSWRQKIIVATKGGAKESCIYTQYEFDSCRWTMYDNYIKLCKKLGITPCKMA